ncbi:MAG: hypothetical protein HYV07_09890 [Deltaproteobacteria bacterium]|nr:hypothetical protein [Deltaproteobacteria bacterium]
MLALWVCLVAIAPRAQTSSIAADDRVLEVLTAMTSSVTERRVSGVERAAETHDLVLLDPLLSAAQDTSPKLRKASALALGSLGVPRTGADLERVLRTLAKLIDDPYEEVSLAAMTAFARFPFPFVRSRLEAVLKDSDPDRRALARALLDAPPGSELRERLLGYASVLMGDARRGDRPPKPEERHGRLPGDHLSQAAAFVARSVEARDAIVWLPRRERFAPFFESALRDADPALRRAAAAALVHPALAPRRAALSVAFRDPDAEVRKIAARIAAAPEIVRAATIQLGVESDPSVREALMASLVAGDGAVVEEVGRWIELAAEPSALAGLRALDGRSGPSVIEVWVRAATRRPGKATEEATKALAKIPDVELVPPVLARLGAAEAEARPRLLALLDGRDVSLVEPGLFAELEAGRADGPVLDRLSKVADDRALPEIIRVLDAGDPRAREGALRAVGKRRSRELSDALGRLVERDPSASAAFERLMEQEAPDARGAVVRLLADPRMEPLRERLLRKLPVDAEVAGLVASAVVESPSLAPVALELLAPLSPSAEVLDAYAAVAGLVGAGDAHRIGAIEALRVKGSTAAISRLEPSARDESVDVKLAARAALHDIDPRRYPSWDPYGRIPLVLEGSVLGASALLIAADVSSASLSPVFTGVVGAVLGGATPYLLTRKENVSLGEAGFFGTAALWGTALGWGAGGSLELDDRGTGATTLVGQALGAVAGGFLLGGSEWGPEDAVLANVLALEVAMVGGQASALANGTSPFHHALVAGAVASIPAMALSRSISLEGDGLTLGTTVGVGSFLGMLAPGFLVEDELTFGSAMAGVLAGQAVGFVAGVGLSELLRLDLQQTAFSALGTASGASLLAGAALLFDVPARGSYALADAGALAGAIGLGAIANRLEMKRNDAWITALATLAGAFAGARFEVHAEEDSFGSRAFPGGILAGAGAGFGLGLGVSQLVDASDSALAWVLASGLTTGTGGAGSARLFGLRARDRGLVTGLSALLGVGLAAPFAEELELDSSTLEMMVLHGVAGASLGSLLSEYTSEPDEGTRRWGGAVFGGALGAVTGVVLGVGLERSAASAGSFGLGAGLSSGAGLGLALELEGAPNAASVQLGSVLGLAAGRALVGLATPERQRSAYTHASLGTFVGALEGSSLGLATEIGGRRTAGSALAGAGLGAFAGASLGLLLDDPLDAFDLLETGVDAGLAGSFGLGLGAALDESRVGGTISAVTTLVGAAAGIWVSPRTSFELSDTDAVVLAMGLGAGFGLAAPAAFGVSVGERAAGGLLAGGSLGALLGVAWSQLGTDRDELEVLVDAAAGSSLGFGIGRLLSDADEPQLIGLEAAGLVATALAVGLTPRTTLGDGDLLLLGAGAGLGAWFGAALPAATGRLDFRGIDAGITLGLGAGYFGAYVGAQLLDPEPSDVLESSLFAMSTSLGALGLAESLSGADGQHAALALELAGAVGVVSGALLAPITSYSPEDRGLVTLLGSSGALHGAFLPVSWGGGASGWASLFGGSVGVLGGLAASQLVEVEGPDAFDIVLVQLAADMVGSAGGWLVEGRDRDAALGFELAGAVGLGAGVALAPLLSLSEDDGLLVGTMAGAGAIEGGILAELAPHAEGSAVLLGAGLGLGAGLALSSFVELDAAAQAEAVFDGAALAAMGSGLWLTFADKELGATGRLMTTIPAAIGFGVGLALAPETELSGTDRGLLAELSLIGAWHGSTIPVVFSSVGTQTAGALLGAGVFAGAGLVLTQLEEYTTPDLLEIATASILANAVGLGLGASIPAAGDRETLALADGFGLAGLGAALLFAKDLELEADDAWPVMGSAALLAGFGGFLPVLWLGEDQERSSESMTGSMAFGSSAGILLGAVLADAGMSSVQARSATFGGTAGSMLGGGLGLLFSKDDRLGVALLEGLGIAGAAAGGFFELAGELDAGEVALGIGEIGYLTWHALGVSLLLDGTDRETSGAVLAAVGAGALAGAVLVPHLELSGTDLWMLFAGSVWGGWIGGWGAALFEDALPEPLLGQRSTGLALVSTVLGSDVGLGVVSLLVSEVLDVEPTRFAVINLSGLGGMMVGMLVAGFAQSEPLGAGNVIGSLAGLVGGSIVTSFLDFSEEPSPYDQALPEKSAPGLSVKHWVPGLVATPEPQGGRRIELTVSGVFD